MKNFLLACIVLCATVSAISQNRPAGNKAKVLSTQVNPALQGVWMYGNFSMKEYWAENPASYLGNALQMAIAFKFNADGSYEQYFTSRSVIVGITTYQQSVTKGTFIVDENSKTIVTHPLSSHYKRTQNNKTVEERDMLPTELNGDTKYGYKTGEENGVKALYLQLATSNPLPFLKKF